MASITPTVGRIVWFRPNGQHFERLHEFDTQQPMAAQVLFVHEDGPVNLLVTDHAGYTRPLMRVHLMQEDGPTLADGQCFAEWMPYQKGQAKQHETSTDTATA